MHPLQSIKKQIIIVINIIVKKNLNKKMDNN